MNETRRLWLVGLVAFVMAVAGVFVGRAVMEPAAPSPFELHARINDELKLDPDQLAKLATVEETFNLRRSSLETQMREANQQLALAIQVEHGYGPQVTVAIDDTHRLMGDLQKETLQYLFSMRDVLDDEQAAKFDVIVADALTTDAQ